MEYSESIVVSEQTHFVLAFLLVVIDADVLAILAVKVVTVVVPSNVILFFGFVKFERVLIQLDWFSVVDAADASLAIVEPADKNQVGRVIEDLPPDDFKHHIVSILVLSALEFPVSGKVELLLEFESDQFSTDVVLLFRRVDKFAELPFLDFSG